MQNLTNISNYLGEYKIGNSYKKFDFVFNPYDGLFYYAKNDIAWSEEVVLTASNRFSLDPWGPIYGGLQTYYLNDSHNDMSDYIVGQEIEISGSLSDNNGSFKILSIDRSFNPYSVRPGDYILYEALDAEEVSGQLNWFASDWFIFDSKNFYWPGRDFTAYVDRYVDLLQSYESSNTTLSKEDWGRDHYENYGYLEDRTIPLNNRTNWIFHPVLGWVYISNRGIASASGTEKSIWFNLEPHQRFWFYTKSNFQENNIALVKYKEEPINEYLLKKDSESQPFNNPDIREVDVSSDGSSMIARDDGKITRYSKQAGSWVQQSSIDFGEVPYRYLCTDGDCNTVVAFSYQNGYYTVNKKRIIDTKEEFENYNDWNSVFGDQNSFLLYQALNKITPWKKIDDEDVDLQKIKDLNSSSLFKYAGDVIIYRFNETSGDWEIQDTIEKVVEHGISADISSDGNSLMIFEPNQIEYMYFKGKEVLADSIYELQVATSNKQKISIYEKQSGSFESSLIIAQAAYYEFSQADLNDVDEYGYSKILSSFSYPIVSNEYDNANLILFSTTKPFILHETNDFAGLNYINDEIPFGHSGASVRMSRDGSSIFFVSDIEGYKEDFICFRKGINGWVDTANSVDIELIYKFSGISPGRRYPGAADKYNISVNHNGTILISYGQHMAEGAQYVFDDLRQEYKEGQRASLFEASYIKGGLGWKYTPAFFESFTSASPSSGYINDLIFSSGNKIRIAAIIGRQLNPKKKYEHLLYPTSIFNLRRFYTESSPFVNATVSVLELNNQNEWEQVYEIQKNTIDFAADSNLDDLYNLKFDYFSSEKNMLEVYGIQNTSTYLLNDSGEGWAYIKRSSPGKIFDLYNIDEQQWFSFDKSRVLAIESSEVPSIAIQPDDGQTEDLIVDENFGTRVWLRGVSDQDRISNLEERSENEITITSKNININLGSEDWSSDLFFFDADYGSSVKFSCQNKKYTSADGYYINQPLGINSLRMEINLLFKNRNNRETNAILHFVESHLGQYDKDRPSFNLRYKQGIKGFRWGGDSSFHPYDSTEIQSKDFYCLDYSHSLNFEDSNDVSLKLVNLNTSILNKSESLYVKPAPTYSSQEYYEKNDVVFFPENHKYYYCISESLIINMEPTFKKSSWSRDGGYFLDANEHVWTRDFLWKPSLGLNISQTPRMKISKIKEPYSQVYNDGINSNLLNLSLKFENRGDDEAYAILHFLEHHYGCIPFNFNPPSPYKEGKNFVCQQWSHTYNYKNNHTIEAVFEEFPFQLDSSKYDAIITEPILRKSELILPETLIFEDAVEKLIYSNKFRKRLYIKNSGDLPMTVNSIISQGNFFDLVSDKMVINKAENNNIISLPQDLTLPFGLSGQTIKIFPKYSEGISGGTTFTIVDLGLEGYERRRIEGVLNVFFQDNTGKITNLISGESSISYNKFINEGFFDINYNNVINSGEEGFVDVYYTANITQEYFNQQVQDIDFLTSELSSSFVDDDLIINVTHSDDSVESTNLKLKINLHNV